MALIAAFLGGLLLGLWWRHRDVLLHQVLCQALIDALERTQEEARGNQQPER